MAQDDDAGPARGLRGHQPPCAAEDARPARGGRPTGERDRGELRDEPAGGLATPAHPPRRRPRDRAAARPGAALPARAGAARARARLDRALRAALGRALRAPRATPGEGRRAMNKTIRRELRFRQSRETVWLAL